MSQAKMTCAFCTLPQQRVVDSNEYGMTVRDSFPVARGHTLVIPKRHIASFFDLRRDEQHALLALLEAAKVELDQEFRPNAYNIGINDGAAAGQTVPHAHVHLIPRFSGDCPDPRGGVQAYALPPGR